MIKSKIKASNALRVFCALLAAAVWCLPSVKAEDIMEKSAVVFEKLKDADPTVRSAEARRLGAEKVKEAVPALIEALKDKVTGVRINAVVSLGKLGDERAIEPLTDILNNDRVPAARMKASEALAAFNAEGILPELIKTADSKDENVRVSAVRSLGKTGGDAAVEKLIEKSRSDGKWRVRQAAVAGLTDIVVKGKVRNKKIEKAVKIAAKKDKNPQVREAAEKALKKMPKKKKKWWFF